MDARTADTYQLRDLAPTDLKAYKGPLVKGKPPSSVVVKYAPFDVRSRGITYSKRVFLGIRRDPQGSGGIRRDPEGSGRDPRDPAGILGIRVFWSFLFSKHVF